MSSAASALRSVLSLRSSCASCARRREDVFHPLADVVDELLVLGVQLLAQIALVPRHQIVELRELLIELLSRVAQLAPEVLVAGGPAVLLGPQAVALRLHLRLHVRLERRQSPLHLFSEIRRLLDETLLEPGELAVVVPHLPAEEQIADLVEVAAGCAVRLRKARQGFLIAAGRHGSLPCSHPGPEARAGL